MKRLCLLLLILSTKAQSLTNYSNYLQQLKVGPNLTINKCGQESFSGQSNECETLIKEYEDTRNEMWDIHKNPSKYELSDESFLNGEADKLINDKLDQLYDIGNQCLKKRFETCYPDLNETIDLATLNTIYNDLKDDHSFRMKAPEAACYKRAKRLGFKLAEQGYKTEIIHIKDAPTLIAPLLDAKDNYLGGFLDYHGQHYVIAIKSSDGNSYILDPQFSEVPLKKEDYFMKTIGSICVNANLSKNDAGIWGCTYQKYDLAHEIQFGEDFKPTKNSDQYKDENDDSIEKVLHDKTKASCGYVKPSDNYFNPKNKPETISKTRAITDNTRGEIIVASLQNLYEYRKNNIKDEIYEQDKKEQYPNYSDQIEQFENHIKKVCEYFKFSERKCKMIRKKYSKYLTGKIE